mgnify:CR=1 FL=1
MRPKRHDPDGVLTLFFAGLRRQQTAGRAARSAQGIPRRCVKGPASARGGHRRTMRGNVSCRLGWSDSRPQSLIRRHSVGRYQVLLLKNWTCSCVSCWGIGAARGRLIRCPISSDQKRRALDQWYWGKIGLSVERPGVGLGTHDRQFPGSRARFGHQQRGLQRGPRAWSERVPGTTKLYGMKSLPSHLSKFQPLMPRWVEREVWATYLLDVAGAQRWLGQAAQG